MARAQTREVSGPSAIQGIASPVNFYVRPADPAPSNLHQLAEGLSSLDRDLTYFMGKRKEKSDEADKQRAIKDSYLADGDGYDEGVKRGIIPPQESPAYMKWYNATSGDVRGRKLQDKFQVAYQQWEGRNAGDPEAFKAFVQEFLNTEIGGIEDPEILAGLNPHIEGILSSGYEQFTKDRANHVYSDALSTHGAAQTDNIRRAEEEGRASGETDYEGLWTTLMQERSVALTKNLEKDVDSFLVESVLTQAVETGNEDLLKLLDNQLPGKDYALSSDVEVRQKINRARDQIETNLSQRATSQREAEDRADKIAHNTKVAEVITRLSADPNAEVTEDELKELSRRDPEFRTKLPEFRKKLLSDGTAEDPEALLEVYTRIDQGAGQEFIFEMRRKGVIKDPDTLTKALDRVKARDGATRPGGIFTTESFKDTEKRIRAATATSGLNPLEAAAGMTDDAARAMQAYRTMLLDWEKQNPGAGIVDREKAAYDIGRTIQDRIQPDPTDDKVGIYPEEPAAKSAEPQADPAKVETPEPGAPQEQPQATQPGTPEGDGLDNDEAGELAKQYGITREQAQEMLLDEGDEPEPEAPAQDGSSPGILRRIYNYFTGADEQASVDNPFDAVLDNAPTVDNVQTASFSTTPVPPPNPDPKLPAGMRNNNPGNIKFNPDAPWDGLVGPSQNTDQGDPQAVFESPELGMRAAAKLAMNKYAKGMTTANQIIAGDAGWTPGNTQAAANVARSMGLGPDDDLGLDDPQNAQRFLRALVTQEHGKASGQYTDQMIAQGVQMAKASSQVASADPDGGFREFFADTDLAAYTGGSGRSPRGMGMMDLVVSNKRGRAPDMENLRPEIKQGVSDLQKAFGRELPIVSGFRDKARNAKAGGAKHSQHTHGNAVDIDVSHLGRAERIRLIQMARQQGFGGIGIYRNSIHLDKGSKRAWGPSHHADTLPKWAADALS